MTDTGQHPPLKPLGSLGPETLTAVRQRIMASGELGRSRIYTRLFDYLLEASAAGRSPKEIEIAINVLGRDSDFDVSRDSAVRVYIHQLRKRLQRYYQRQEPDARYQLVLPRGQYLFAVADHHPESTSNPSDRRRLPDARLQVAGMALLLLVSVLLNLWWWTSDKAWQEPGSDGAGPQLLDHPMWSNILDDGLPVMVAMGDYYLFGEQDAGGRVTRLIRDFTINSPADLARAEETLDSTETPRRFVDLSMTYMPEGSAPALAMIAAVTEQIDKPVAIRMMSQLSRADLRDHHVIYIGYVSGLGILEPLFLAASSLQVGQSYDELYLASGRQLFTSNAAQAGEGEALRDLALLATVPAVNDNQIIIVAGTRDPGLREAARIATDIGKLRDIDATLSLAPRRAIASHEALFRLSGTDDVISDVELIYSGALDPTRIWSRQID